MPQLNLHYTDVINQSQNDNNNNNTLQHTCLRIVPSFYEESDTHEIVSYCMSELASKFNVQNDSDFSKFTFSDLLKLNTTSQQLYLWSAPFDLIERYQLYLNELSTTNNSLLSGEIYYNCTIPRFGPTCQYELFYYRPRHLSLNEIIKDFYWNSQDSPTNLTCYTHLECNRSLHSSCLDWTEICNEEIDCVNGGVDEEHCWQLEINQCKDDEYRCRNGQCIPKLFFQDDYMAPNCIDASDVKAPGGRKVRLCSKYTEPSIRCEDVTCADSFATSSCDAKRESLLIDMMYSNNDPTVSQDCWSAFKCLVKFLQSQYATCDEFCQKNDCKKIFTTTCPQDLFFPNVPVLFNNIYFVYRKSDFNSSIDFSTVPFYICYNTSQYDHYFINISKIFFNNLTCVNSKLYLSLWNPPTFPVRSLHTTIIRDLYKSLKRYHVPLNYTSALCKTSKMYQCIHSSKCISIHHLMDRISDCPYEDDENFSLINTSKIIEQLNKTHYQCQSTNKYIHQSLVENLKCDCEENESEWCEEEDLVATYIKRNIIFQHICDGFIDLLPVPITGKNETDETECEQWQCSNIYTRCNGVWNCPNGVDESGCKSHPTLNCTSKQHLCISPVTNKFMCLPVEKANDDNVDCLGATDEPKLCRPNIQLNLGIEWYNFYCMNKYSESCISNLNLCDGKEQCENGNDEQFCTTNRTGDQFAGVCSSSRHLISKIEQFLCDIRENIRFWQIIYFQIIPTTDEVEYLKKNIENPISPSSSIIKMSEQHQPRCHRGLDLRVWINNEKGLTDHTCLCPHSYYGDRCQYQNQRISLAIMFRVLSASRQTFFAIVISLIDDSYQRIIHSYEQFTYLSIRDCKHKFNIHLLYATRPKDPTKNYSIHIDIYENEKTPLVYRGSVLLPVTFSFLPVHLLAHIVDIPRSNDKSQSCSNKQCVHGKCIKYSNNPQNLTFCQCDKEWSGKYCNIQHKCICASDSLCIGISTNNRSICICPMNRFGSRCFLNKTIYQTNNSVSCQNGSRAVLDDDYFVPYHKFVCICPKGYSGDHCEIADNQLVLSFANDIAVSQSIFIHFIEVLRSYRREETIVRGSIFQSMPLRQDSMMIYWSKPFHLVFTELFNKTYYLTVFQKEYNQSSIITKMIHTSDHCPHVRQLFNQTIAELHLLRRIKYYHLLCQNQSLNLSCFYDEVHLCLCYDFEDEYLANCFKFDHNMSYDCFGQNECENGGQCLQDTRDCPRTSVCICAECFYGRRCQFSTSGFGLSLDTILGYHIIPNVTFIRQSAIIKISLALTIIFIAIGLINGIISLLTFKNKVIREVGCGIYLLETSITSLFTMIMFGLKFLILLFAQMSTISNRTFLQFQCHSLDFILQVCLYMDQWLNACVALERAMTTIKGTAFNKKKSKKAAKYVIIGLLIMICSTCIHDAIYRRLIDEENDIDNMKRTWCIVQYSSSSLEVYNYIIHCLHFFGPFLINLLSSIILVTKKSRQQATLHAQRSYREILREQIRQHKHVLIAPIVLVVLAVPRLIITFLSKCMKSADDVWLYLIGYFISFIPSMLTFVVFIVPSKFYKKEFRTTIQQVRTTIQRRLHLTSQR